jgi:hypothetical protein
LEYAAAPSLHAMARSVFVSVSKQNKENQSIPWIDALFDNDEDIGPNVALLQPVDELGLGSQTRISAHLRPGNIVNHLLGNI